MCSNFNSRRNAAGEPYLAPGVSLFGHACAQGGVILRPGTNRIFCGNGHDAGARCVDYCPHVSELENARTSGAGGREEGETSRHEVGQGGGEEEGEQGAPLPIAAPHEETIEQPCDGAWAPEDVHHYLRTDTEAYQRRPDFGKYNEFLLDGNAWEANLPHSIDAFMSSRTGDVVHTHAAFLRAYGLTEADVPLLTMAPSLQTPFVLGSGFAREGDPTDSSRVRGSAQPGAKSAPLEAWKQPAAAPTVRCEAWCSKWTCDNLLCNGCKLDVPCAAGQAHGN